MAAAITESRDDVIAKSILAYLDLHVNQTINLDREFIDMFVKDVDDNLPRCKPGDSGYTVSFSHGGSAYEGLAVTEDVDADITAILGKPFEGTEFTIKRDEASKFFTLKWKTHVARRIFCDNEGYADASQIRSALFEGIEYALQNLRMSNATVKVKKGLTAVTVDIERKSGRNISIDFVPQIVFRSWDQCPDLLPVSEMPRVLRQYVDTLNKNKSPTMCLSLAVPHEERYINNHRLFNISFSLLEKEYFKSKTNVRDMVRLVKFVAKHYDWKDNGFKSYYAKRVAIKNDEVLSLKGLWKGFQHLLWCIRDQLARTGTIDGYFVDEQVTYKKSREVTEQLISKIDLVRQMSPEDVKSLLDI